MGDLHSDRGTGDRVMPRNLVAHGVRRSTTDRVSRRRRTGRARQLGFCPGARLLAVLGPDGDLVHAIGRGQDEHVRPGTPIGAVPSKALLIDTDALHREGRPLPCPLLPPLIVGPPWSTAAWRCPMRPAGRDRRVGHPRRAAARGRAVAPRRDGASGALRSGDGSGFGCKPAR